MRLAPIIVLLALVGCIRAAPPVQPPPDPQKVLQLPARDIDQSRQGSQGGSVSGAVPITTEANIEARLEQQNQANAKLFDDMESKLTTTIGAKIAERMDMLAGRDSNATTRIESMSIPTAVVLVSTPMFVGIGIGLLAWFVSRALNRMTDTMEGIPDRTGDRVGGVINGKLEKAIKVVIEERKRHE